MTYAAVSDAQALVPRLTISATSVPTTAQVQGFLDQCSAEIDSALGSLGVAVPVTTPSWFVTDLLRLNATGAAAQAWLAAFPDTAGPAGGGLGATLSKIYQNRLDQFRKNQGVPATVSNAELDRSPRSYFTDIGAAATDDEVTDAAGDLVTSKPAFTREKQF